MILLVTGGSRGIGAATARLAAARGYDVCVNYRINKDAASRIVGDVGCHEHLCHEHLMLLHALAL